jgi:hypothetical protein
VIPEISNSNDVVSKDAFLIEEIHDREDRKDLTPGPQSIIYQLFSFASFAFS